MYFVYKFIFYTSSSTVFVCVFSGCHWKQLHCSRLLPDAACSIVCCLLPSSCWHTRNARATYIRSWSRSRLPDDHGVSQSHCVCVCVWAVIAASSYCSYATACTADGDRSELPLSKQPLKHLICAKAAEPIRCGFVMIVDEAHEWTVPAAANTHARDSDVLACNFAKYSPIFTFFSLTELAINLF